MSQPNSQPSFLALPSFAQPFPNPNDPSTASTSSSSKGLHLPSGSTPKKRKLNTGSNGGSKKSKNKSSDPNDRRELDERDDVDEADLISGAGAEGGLRGIDEDYDEAEAEDEGGEGVGVPEAGEEVVEEGATAGAGAAQEGTAKIGGGNRRAGVKKKGAAASLGIDVAGIIAKGRAMKADQIALRDTLPKDSEELKRFDAYITASIGMKPMKKLNKDMFDQTFKDTDSTPTYLGGLAKIFVTEVVEIAKDIQAQSPNPSGPLTTYHLKLARQVLEERGMLGASSSRDSMGSGSKKPLFRR